MIEGTPNINVMRNVNSPKVTKPWSKEMYEWNDFVASLMKGELKVRIENAYKHKNYSALNELIRLCSGVRYADGFTLDDLYNECNHQLTDVPNYWLASEWGGAVKKGIVGDCVKVNFVGY
jgi:hypothetical protein